MRSLLRTTIVLLGSISLTSLAHARKCEDVQMSNAARAGDTALVLNGMGVREATVFNVNVYVAGLYTEARTRNAADILAGDKAKRLVLHFVRDVERSDISEAFQTGFGGDAADLRRLNGWMSDMSEGDRMMFTYVPGTGLEVHVKGRRKGVIEGDAFQRAFFSIWLGSSPPNAGLKSGMLGGSCG